MHYVFAQCKSVCYPEEALRNGGLNSHDDLITLQTHKIIIFEVRNNSDTFEEKIRAERIILQLSFP